MKKFLLTLILSVATLQPISAQSYRGFADIDGGITIYDSYYAPIIGITTTHGVQLAEKFFIGAGIGLETVGTDCSFEFDDLSIPLYGDFRYDHWTNKKISLFAEFRIGYNIKFHGDMKNYILVKPVIGIRFRINDRMGINIGISYAPYKKTHEWFSVYDNATYYDSDHHNAITIKAGIDF